MPFGIDPNVWDSALRAMARGHYSLLLGAGASIEALSRHGERLPSAKDLARRIAEDFGLGSRGAELGLSRAYERAKRRNADGRSVYEYLTDQLTMTSPPTWYEHLCSIRWFRIWTLNIDDVVEQAYAKWVLTRAQNPLSLGWADSFREPNHSDNEVIVLHLHGKCRQSGEADPVDHDLVFDIMEYLRASGSSHAWHHIFGDEFSDRPFIVVGARLTDEYDLAPMLRRGNFAGKTHGYPSFIVLRHFDEGDKEEFQEWGLIPVAADASTFFSTLNADIGPYLTEAIQTVTGIRLDPANEAIQFLQQFRWLKLEHQSRPSPHHDFLSGDDPDWSDILDDRDAEFGIVDRVTEAILQGNVSQVVHCLRGEAFSGKSTALLRIAKRLIVAGFDVFFFRGDDRPSVEAIRWWLRQSPKTILLFDGVADFAYEIGDLVTACMESSLPLIVVATERSSRARRLYSSISASVLNLHSVGGLSDPDIVKLLSKLTEATRLGQLTGSTHEQRLHYFIVTNSRELFAGMSNLERGRGFDLRLRTLYGSVKQVKHRRVYIVCCLSYALGYALPPAILCAAADVSHEDLFKSIDEGELADVLQLWETRVKPRHRKAATTVVDALATRQEKHDLTVSLARQLSPYVTRNTVRERALPYLIARELMDHEVLGGWIGRENLEQWYATVEPDYSWDARFWEQRALAEVSQRQYDKAESYAAHAVKLLDDAFTLNTYGLILLKKAIEWFPNGSDESRAYYWKAVDQLYGSRSRSRQRHGYEKFEHPFFTFFSYTLRFAEHFYNGPVTDVRMRNEWNRWYSAALHAPPFQHYELRDVLDRFHNRWLILNATAEMESPS